MAFTPKVPPWSDGETAHADWLNAVESSLAEHDAAIAAINAQLIAGTMQYNFNTTTAPPVPSNQFRLNNTNANSATIIYFSWITAGGADVRNIFRLFGAGGLVVVQDFNDAAIAHKYNVTGAATEDVPGEYFSLPVTWVSGSGVFSGSQKHLIVVARFLA